MNRATLYERYIEEVARRHRAEIFWLAGEDFRPWADLSAQEKAGYIEEAAAYIEDGRDDYHRTFGPHTVSYQ